MKLIVDAQIRSLAKLLSFAEMEKDEPFFRSSILTVRNGELIITAVSPRVGVQIKGLEIDGEDSQFVVMTKTLLHILETCGDSISLTSIGDFYEINDPAGTFHVNQVLPRDFLFPELPSKFVKLDLKNLLKDLNIAAHFLGNDVTRMFLSGVYWGDQILASDSNKFFIAEDVLRNESPVLFDPAILDILSLSKESTFEVGVSRAFLFFRKGEIVIYSRLFESTFPQKLLLDMKKKACSNVVGNIDFLPGPLEQALERLKLFATDFSFVSIVGVNYMEHPAVKLAIMDLDTRQNASVRVLVEGFDLPEDFAFNFSFSHLKLFMELRDVLGSSTMEFCEADNLGLAFCRGKSTFVAFNKRLVRSK